MPRSSFLALALVALACLHAGPASAQSDAPAGKRLRLFSEDATDTSFTVQRKTGKIEISRVMTPCAKNEGWFQPLVPVAGVTPVGEAEILHALNDPQALVVDMRTAPEYLKATIPGSINMPYTEVATRMDELGCKRGGSGSQWDCSGARKLYAFCNGPVCPQSPIAIRAITRDGYPAAKIFYYRGGMLDWMALGLTTQPGEF